VAFPVQRNPQCVATGGQEKKLRIFDLSQESSNSVHTAANGASQNGTSNKAFEIGAGEHTASIKSIVWNKDYNILTTAADDKTIRWWDLRSQRPIASLKTEADITSCELSTNDPDGDDAGILSVAAGHTCYFFDGGRPGELIKKVNFGHDIASVAINPANGRFVTGGRHDFWARVYDLASETELGMLLMLKFTTTLTKYNRCPKRPPRTYLVNVVFSGWKVVRDRK
jgi:serine-threonine kinase receptor-associated protein